MLDEARLSYYGSREQEEDKKADSRQQESKLRMKYGKNWKKFTQDVDNAKDRLRPGEVRRFNRETGKWESNKD